MILLGTIINTLTILIGGCIGSFTTKNLPSRFNTLIMNSLGLICLVIGISFSIKSEHLIVVILSLVLGGILGEWIDFDQRLNLFGDWLQKKFSKRHSRFSEGFITASLLFCVGSMAIMGSLESGLSNRHTILYTKSLLDGISSLIFATTMGIGVALSAFCVFIYQGSITLLASFISPYISQPVILEMNAVGGILLMGIALSLLEIKKIKVANLLPALFLPIILFLFL